MTTKTHFPLAALLLFSFLASNRAFPAEKANNEMITAAMPLSAVPDTFSCEPVWRYGITGEYIGEASLAAIDIDNNGVTDLVMSAQYEWMGYWYVMHYDLTDTTYVMDWVSNAYDNMITRLGVFDLDQDSIYEVYAGFDNGEILVFKGDTKEILDKIPAQSSSEIKDMQVGDANNDGMNELVISTSTTIYFYNTSTLGLEFSIAYGAESFRIANVDQDTLDELVTTRGMVLEITGQNVLEQWSFDNSNDADFLMGLEDLDNDGVREIIRAKASNQISVWDADIETLKFTYNTNSGIRSLNFYDINNDGVKDVVYGEDQWGSINFINPLTQQEIWTIPNPENDVTDVCIADFDGDNADEIGWAANWFSSAGDLFIVKDVHTKVLEYVSPCLDGPFYALETGDVDNDGTQEIVAISYESEGGYGSGIISVFDAVTHHLEWQCDGQFLYNVWRGTYNLEINDIDNDGTQEIIVAADQVYVGKIWVINGITKVIESSFLFQSLDFDEFRALAVYDIDGDGDKEYITAVGDDVLFINPDDYSIEWDSGPILASYTPITIEIGNVDNDPADEIVICGKRLNVIDAVTHAIWNTNSMYGFSCMDLHDVNGDSIKEIILGDENPGKIYFLNGTTHWADSVINIGPDRIDAVKFTDLNHDSIYELIYTTAGRLYIVSDTSINAVSQKFGGELGTVEALKINDINGDNKPEIVMGTTTMLLEFNSDAYGELFLSGTISLTGVSCHGYQDGTAVIHLSNGVQPYTFLWNNGSTDSIITQLPAGIYSVTATDATGRHYKQSVTITEPDELLLQTFSTPDISNTPAFEGTAIVVIQGGTPPYTILWSDSGAQTGDSVFGLMPGTYYVWVTDSMGCSTVDTVVVNLIEGISDRSSQNGIFVHPNPTTGILFFTGNVQCNRSGIIMVSDPVGSIVLRKELNDSTGMLDISFLEPGLYIVSISSNTFTTAFKVQLIR
jgi:hypothetical protein